MYLGKWPADFVVPRIVTARKGSFGQGNVFTPVYLFTGAWGSAQPLGCRPPPPAWRPPFPMDAETHGCRPPPGCRPPSPDTPSPWMQTPPPPRYGQRADGTHPTGMHTCWDSHPACPSGFPVNSSNALQAIITKYGSRVTE